MRWAASPLPIFIAVYALLYAAFGVQSPFLPALLRERGLHADEISIVLAAATAMRVLAGPAFGHAADRWHAHTLILSGCAIAAAIAGLGYVTLTGVGWLLAVALAHAASLAPVVPISDALATTSAQASETGRGRRFDYGWLRAAGSASFIAGTVLSGWSPHRAGLAGIIWLSGALLVAGGCTALLLPGIARRQTVTARMHAPALREWALLFRIAVFRRILAIAALVEGSHALNDTFAVIHWRAAGVKLGIVSLLWSESVFSEVLVFLLIGPWLIRRIGPRGGCSLAAAAGIVRWSVLAGTSSPWLLALVQPLHGLTFALLHLSCMRVIVLAVPFRLAATAQSLYGTLCVGLATALLTLAAGVLYQRFGGEAFLAMSGLCLLALPICAGLNASNVQTDRRYCPGNSDLR
jgi:MFS transporter, PPP family, 3-phenylpropionic acid transporter